MIGSVWEKVISWCLFSERERERISIHSSVGLGLFDRWSVALEPLYAVIGRISNVHIQLAVECHGVRDVQQVRHVTRRTCHTSNGSSVQLVVLEKLDSIIIGIGDVHVTQRIERHSCCTIQCRRQGRRNAIPIASYDSPTAGTDHPTNNIRSQIVCDEQTIGRHIQIQTRRIVQLCVQCTSNKCTRQHRARWCAH